MNETKEMKKWIILIVIAAICYLLVDNLGAVASVIGKFFSVLFSFILGGALAFILNIPVVKIENLLAKDLKIKMKYQLEQSPLFYPYYF